MWSHFSPVSHSSKFKAQNMYSLGNCVEYDVNVKIDTRKNHFYVYNSIVKAISKFSYFKRKKASLENTVLQQIRKDCYYTIERTLVLLFQICGNPV